jgi:PmbA protein
MQGPPFSAEQLVKKLRCAGIEECEAYCTSAQTISIEFAGGGYKTKDYASDSGYGLRAISGKRMGFAYSNRKDDFEKTAKTALTLSRISPKTAFEFEPGHKKFPSVNTVDKRILDFDEKDAFSAIDEVRQGMGKLAEPARISLAVTTSSEEIANSSSLSAEASYTAFDFFVEAKKGKGLGFAIHSSLFLPDDFRSLGKKAAQIASAMDGAKPIATRKVDVRLSQYMLASLLDFTLFHFDGDNKRRGISKLAKGDRKFPEEFSILSDPLAKAAGACSFDGEGIPSSKKFLVNKGRVENFIYDKYTSSLEGKNEEGGHCQRADYAYPPCPGVSNLIISKGDATREELRAGEHLEIISFHGLHTSDPVSGDFGVEVDTAFLHSKGKKTPVNNVLLSANVFNLFNSIKLIGKEQKSWGNFIAPEILFSSVQIIGK